MMRLLAILVSTLFAFSAQAQLSTPNWSDNLDSAVGMNMQKQRFEEPSTPFLNTLKVARQWRYSASPSACGTQSGNYAGALDANGYPTAAGFASSGHTCIFTELFTPNFSDGAWPLGTWTLMWDGDATFAVDEAAGSYSVVSAGKATFVVSSTGGNLELQIATLPTSVFNMRLYPPGGMCVNDDSGAVNHAEFCNMATCPSGVCPDAITCGTGKTCTSLDTVGEAGTATFHPLWISRLGQYRMLRFMNWTHTNRSVADTMASLFDEDRWSWDHNGPTPANVPLSVIAKLCNQVNAACHVNMPHLFADAEMTLFMEFFRDNVNWWLPIYVEFSNEVWNPRFQQHHDVGNMGYTRWLADNGSFLGGDACEDGVPGGPYGDTFSCSTNAQGMRNYEMCVLGEAVFSYDPSRFHCINATRSQSDHTEYDKKLDCDRWLVSPDGDCYTGRTMIAALNGYFGGGCTVSKAASCTSMAAAAVNKFTDADTHAVTEVKQALDARSLTWPIMIYEGGAAFDDTNEQICIDLATDADSCIADEYPPALTLWKELDTIDGYNLETFMLFNHSGRYWSGGNLWGHRGSNEGAWPKESGVMEWDNTPGNECWWPECEIALPEPSSSLGLSVSLGMILLIGLARTKFG
jgi:hypothetical protein